MDSELIGASIQICSSLLALVGITLQRRAMFQQSPLEELEEEFTHKETVKFSYMWLLGFCLYYSSQGIEMLALSFASQTTIVAVSSFSVFVNAAIAVRVFKESFAFSLPDSTDGVLWKRIFRWDLLNLAIMATGSVCTVIFAPRVPEEEEKQFTAEELLHKWIEVPFILYLLGGIILIILLLIRFNSKPSPLALALVLALFSSFSITLAKIVTELVERHDFWNFRSLSMVTSWVFILALEIYYLQQGLKNFEQSGTFSVGGMLGGALTIIAGILYYHTYVHFKSNEQIVGFTLAVALLLYGLLVFSQRKILSREEMKKRLFAASSLVDEDVIDEPLLDSFVA